MSEGVYRRGNGWVYRMDLPRHPDGSRNPFTSPQYRTRKEAQEARRAHQARVDGGGIGRPSKQPLAAYLETWVEGRTGVREASLKAYHQAIRTCIVPYLGTVTLDRITPVRVANWHQKLLADHSPTTVRHAHVILSMAFKQAVAWRMMHENPCTLVEAPAAARQVADYWTVDEARKFLAYTDTHRDAALFRLALDTGMRIGELLALRWDEVDLDRGRIQVRWTLTAGRQSPGSITLGETKTGAGQRLVVVSPVTCNLLRRQRTLNTAARLKAGQWDEQGFVFPGLHGGFRSASRVRIVAKEAMQAAGVKVIRFHDLRHTAATLMLIGRVPAKVVSERLGHANLGITMDLYSHVTEGMQEQAAEVMGRMLGERASGE